MHSAPRELHGGIGPIMTTDRFFWLHIKKCGGQSFRNTFTPPYVQTNRSAVSSKPFIAVPKEEWNDVLNNYRIPLGEYDYRRMTFAKRFLYTKDEFEGMYKFVIVRNPYDRAVSCWKYLFQTDTPRHLKRLRMKYSFASFLSELPSVWETKQDRHMATHTAPIWSDITDDDNTLLVDDIFKLEDIDGAVSTISQKLGISGRGYSHINKNLRGADYRKYYNSKTRRMIEALYENDIRYLNYQF